MRYTERPIVAAAKLREGKFVILVNGSPSALILPTLFCENFECLDDYAGTAYFASFLRVLKYISFHLSIFLPGVFVCWQSTCQNSCRPSCCSKSRPPSRLRRCRCLGKCFW